MGFLDFLKKDKPVANEPDVDLSSVERKIEGPVHADSPVLPPEAPPEDVPVPPPSMRDPDFSDGQSSDDMDLEPQTPPASDFMQEEMEEESPPEPAPEYPEIPADQEEKHVTELPDFSDEDIAAWDADPEEAPAPKESSPEPPPDMSPPPPKPEENPLPPEPVGEPEAYQPPKQTPKTKVEQPPEQPPQPEVSISPPERPAHPALQNMELGMFLSDVEYFTLSNDISDLRKSLRKNDVLVAAIIGQHEHADIQLKRIADNMNTIQERLLDIDGAIFEE